MKKAFLMILFLTTSFIYAQTTITGTVKDADMGTPLPGANVMVKGTSAGTTTDFDGNFSLEVNQLSGEIEITYVGFKAKTVGYSVQQNQTQNLGSIDLMPDASALGEIVLVGRGVIDLEEDRKTPIAVSTITKAEIQQRAVGNVEFPQIMKNTPSVYVSNESGGFGDSEMYVRGFDQTNTAFLLNGQPINGMEDGKMYWSNWAGLSDIANAVQVQRGLGSSKLAISSVGGTINIVTKATNRSEGGFARFLVGNDSYFKGTVSYDTGLGDNGWGFSFLLDYWQAHAKYAKGTRGQGQNYFFSVGKKAGDHNFNFLLTGAPQWHDQNFSKDQELYDKYGIKYNNNYGYNNGEYLSLRRNYYHKPVMNLNWDWNISEKSDLSTVVYASFGRGGGTGDYGNGVRYVDYAPAPENPLQGGAYIPSNGEIDWTYIQNVANAAIEPDENGNRYSKGYDGTLLRASVNNHAWYGSVINYEYDTLKNLTFNVGADVRFYEGTHFRQLTDLLGLDGRVEEFGGDPNHTVTSTFNPDPWAALFNYADEDERIDYDYSENINYQGGFGQVEWANDEFSVFFQGAISNQSYKREDRGNFAETKESETVNKTGYNIKGGASWKFAEGHAFYVNSGKYSRQPFLDNVFPSYSDNTRLAEPAVDNEEIVGLEAGYKFEMNDLQVNLNGYYTKWENRFLNVGGEYDPNPDGDGVPEFDNVSFLFTDIAQLHKGLELDAQYRIMDDLRLKGYVTVGDWEYDGASPVRIRDNTNSEFIDETSAELTGTKVGGAPQFTGGLGVNYDVIPKKLNFDLNWNYYGELYGIVDVEDVAQATLEDETYQSEKLSPYSLFDLGAAYKFNFGDNQIQVVGNIYNLLDYEYIGQKDNYGYYYGNGLTWNLAVKYQF